ncbi:MAG: hypothetical protein GF329_22185 [Candidatus Lokiarchaeota archaeon]|nr:hypothetical protein [Candidatus Lokiarchaeota archaeon]
MSNQRIALPYIFYGIIDGIYDLCSDLIHCRKAYILEKDEMLTKDAQEFKRNLKKRMQEDGILQIPQL